MSFNFMAAVPIYNDFGAPQNKIYHYFHFFPIYLPWSDGKSRGARDQTANICCIVIKARESQKNIYFCFIDYTKTFDSVDKNKLWKVLKEMWTNLLTYLLRNLYAGQEATVRTRSGKTDWFQIVKRVCQGCLLSPCLFNLYADYILQNAGLDEAQTGIKIAGRNINNLRYTDDTTLWTKVKSY